MKRELDHFECRHGLSYTRITGERRGLRAEVLHFVPLGTNAEVHRVTAEATSPTAPKSAKLFSFVEFCLWNAYDDQTNYQRNFSTGEVEVDGSAIYHKTEYRERRDHYAVYAVNAPLAGFDTDRESFFGLWNGWGEAQVPAEGRSRDSVASGWSPIGSHQLAVDLAPGRGADVRLRAGLRREPGRGEVGGPGRREQGAGAGPPGPVRDVRARSTGPWPRSATTGPACSRSTPPAPATPGSTAW